jgi:hypothetical protein
MPFALVEASVEAFPDRWVDPERSSDRRYANVVPM